MLSRFNRYPSSKILGFGTPIQMQKRHCYGPSDKQFATFLVSIVTIPSLAIYLTYKSFSYLYNNYEVVRKDKKNGKNTDLNEKNVTEEYQSTRRPGKM